ELHTQADERPDCTVTGCLEGVPIEKDAADVNGRRDRRLRSDVDVETCAGFELEPRFRAAPADRPDRAAHTEVHAAGEQLNERSAWRIRGHQPKASAEIDDPCGD